MTVLMNLVVVQKWIHSSTVCLTGSLAFSVSFSTQIDILNVQFHFGQNESTGVLLRF